MRWRLKPRLKGLTAHNVGLRRHLPRAGLVPLPAARLYFGSSLMSTQVDIVVKPSGANLFAWLLSHRAADHPHSSPNTAIPCISISASAWNSPLTSKSAIAG